MLKRLYLWLHNLCPVCYKQGVKVTYGRDGTCPRCTDRDGNGKQDPGETPIVYWMEYVDRDK